MKDREKRRRILSYVLYLTLACVLVLGITYARYRSTVTGTGTASVARVALNSTADLSEDLKGMQPGESVKIDVAVSNVEEGNLTSEVTQDYSITVETTGNLPLKFTLVKKNSTAEGSYVKLDTPTVESNGNSTTWPGGQMPHSVITTHDYVLTVQWPNDSKSDDYADEIDYITLTVDAKQRQ